jgi:CDP-paratose 2-epimerase
MKVLITGICGFVGSQLARHLRDHFTDLQVSGIDNLLRPGSEVNRQELAKSGVRFVHGDTRVHSDVNGLPDADWVIDAAANPSVLAGVDGRCSSRQLSEHNLFGTVNLLEYCRERKAGLVLLSSSRVYSVRALASLPMLEKGRSFVLDEQKSLPVGVTAAASRAHPESQSDLTPCNRKSKAAPTPTTAIPCRISP